MSDKPGWNDPPIFSYDQQISLASKRNVLNKRVAFPLTSTSTTNHTGVDPTLPPSLTRNVLPPPVNTFKVESCIENEAKSSGGDKNVLHQIMSIFENVLENRQSATQEKKDSIMKRLNVMENMWNEDKLNNDIYKKMFQLAKALEENNEEKCNEIQVGLMVDYPRLCSTWMPAVRQIIHL